MHGIVLWVNERGESALVWCEDHKGLATYNIPNPENASPTIESGDLVQFDVVDQGEFKDRKAINLRLSLPKINTDLPQKVAEIGQRSRGAIQSSAEFGDAKFGLTKR